MGKIILNIIIVLIYLSSINTSFATKKNFCDLNDIRITDMSALTGNNIIYKGMPKRLTVSAFKNLPKAWDGYCPPCMLEKKICQQRPCQKYNLMPHQIYEKIQAKGDHWMKLANCEALKSIQNGGGAFGAVIVQIDDESGKVIRYWVNHNHVAEWSDPTAHAELTTIRAAAKELGVTNLGHINKQKSKLPQPSQWSHCVIYSSAEPCPMCMAAIYWAGIKNVAFAATRYDAAVKGVNFSDKTILEELALPYEKRKYTYVVHSNIDNSLDAFNYYKRSLNIHYGTVGSH